MTRLDAALAWLREAGDPDDERDAAAVATLQEAAVLLRGLARALPPEDIGQIVLALRAAHALGPASSPFSTTGPDECGCSASPAMFGTARERAIPSTASAAEKSGAPDVRARAR